MPSSAIKRKLLMSANNALKGLTTMLRSKLFRLKRSKAFKRTATGLNAAISTMLGRRRGRRRRFRLMKRRSSLPRLPSDPCDRRKIQRRHGFLQPVYVDDLFATPATPVHIQAVQPAVFADVGKALADGAAAAGGLVGAGPSHGTPPKKVEYKAEPVALARGLGKTAPGDLISRREGRGGASSSSSSSSAVGIPHLELEGVDLRAELFIAKFKEDMRRQAP